jgi:CRISPR-associated helicase Cas3/CRISPR-associated endonuclease Cas3-HD
MFNPGHYYSHSSNKAGSPPELAAEHVRLVAERASRYAAAFDAQDEALVAGTLHDLGKYSGLFLRRLRNLESGLDHWTGGAFVALTRYRLQAVAAALAVQGHHIGLQEGAFTASFKTGFDLTAKSTSDGRSLRVTETDANALVQRLEASGISMPAAPAESIYDHKAEALAGMLDVRMLFSALVDADFIETEAHFQGQADGTKVYRNSGPKLDAQQAFELVRSHLEALTEKASSSDEVGAMRRELLASCLEAAQWPTGLFTLTAPTGAGKTLAMLAFALEHSKLNPHIRRIVMVVPFLSIIEQTARVYRDLLKPLFGEHFVLEHHSLANLQKTREERDANPDNEQEARRTAGLLAENWDAPLILTTSVQFFESLFANRPGRCRKLHRLANSIILFDEVQTLPPRLAVPSLAALSRLAERYGCSVVFSTATQPAFDHLHDNVKPHAAKGWQPRAIAGNPERLFDRARRVRFEWRMDECQSWDAIADELAQPANERALCIVNLKRHARALIERLRDRLGTNDGLFHLSTSMCPAHRERTLATVRSRLASKEPQSCRLIATQCIEAGVDVDFPNAWRAFGPLDAIAQAAGRCNREGRLDTLGRMVVFLPEKEHDREYLYPPGGYKEAAETTQTLLNLKRNEAEKKGIPFEDAFDLYDPALFTEYFRLLYDLTGVVEFDPDRSELAGAVKRRSFVDVDKHYQLIEKQSISLLVPYARELELFESLRERLITDGRLTRRWIQDARGLTISLYSPKDGDTVWNYLDPAPLARGEKADDWFVYLNPKDYDPLLGLTPPDAIDTWTI